LNLLIDEKLPRAYPGGTGGVKNIGNYPPVSYLNLQNKNNRSYL